MKVNLEELELAVKYMKTFSKDISIKVIVDLDSRLTLSFEDKYNSITEITVFNSANQDRGNMSPQIRKTDTLNKDFLSKGTLWIQLLEIA